MRSISKMNERRCGFKGLGWFRPGWIHIWIEIHMDWDFQWLRNELLGSTSKGRKKISGSSSDVKPLSAIDAATNPPVTSVIASCWFRYLNTWCFSLSFMHYWGAKCMLTWQQVVELTVFFLVFADVRISVCLFCSIFCLLSVPFAKTERIIW